MRLVVRKDLGGYASALPGVESLAAVEVERPFVLLCGPNGAGKTAMLQMIRAATGLSGAQQGRVVDEQFERAARVEACGGDLARLAAFRNSFGKDAAPPDRNWAGVLDVTALGWAGHRTWLLDTRSDTNLASASQFVDNDIRRQVGMIFGGRRSSHGQMLQQGWVESLGWALGLDTPDDPYDDPRRLPEPRRALLEAVMPGGRPAERWLFLDEPETALDAEALFVGMSALVREAEVGRLRVFCASHSPIFAAGLGDHPSVQVMDMGGRRPWYEMQRRTLRAAADPAAVETSGATVAGNLRRAAEARARDRAEERATEVADALRGLRKAARELLAEAARNGGRAEWPDTDASRLRSARDDLADRKLARNGFAVDRHVTLTDLGTEAAAALAAAPARKAPARKPKAT